LFHTGGALGIHPSEVSLLGRYPGCYHPEGPTYRLPQRYSRRQSAGPARWASVSGFYPFRESLATSRRISSLTAGASLGFRPSRVHRQRPGPRFRPASSHALRGSDDESPIPPAPRSVNRPSLGSVRTCKQATDKATLLGFLHLLSPEHSSAHPSGLCVHLSLWRTLLPPSQ
jgi:hypothetical protein